MKDSSIDITAIERAVEVCNGQTGLARKLGITPQAVQQWVAAGAPPARRVIAIEIATGGMVTRYQLAPDLYPQEVA
jgi:DNA-binding transcriptional regulator YdaS (Cro superfamily)